MVQAIFGIWYSSVSNKLSLVSYSGVFRLLKPLSLRFQLNFLSSPKGFDA